MSKITPFLWFDTQAGEAMEFYTSVFKNSKILNVSRNGDGGPGQPGSVFIATIEIEGQKLMLLNAGPEFKFTEAFSLYVDCKDQAEVDYYWEKLTADGGEESMCGWLKDKYGLSWQIVPQALGRLMGDPDPAKGQRVMQAMLKMRKLDVSLLQAAHDA